MTDWIIAALLGIGSAFVLVSSLGLARLPDFYTRLHGPTKAATLGAICILAAAVLFFSFEQHNLRARILLAIAFVFLTAPVGVHMLAKAARFLGVPMAKHTREE